MDKLKTKKPKKIRKELYGFDSYSPMNLSDFRKLLSRETKGLKDVKVALVQRMECYCYCECNCTPTASIEISGIEK